MAKKNQFLIDGLFGFDGRFRRSEYWISTIGVGVVRLIALLICGAVLGMGWTEAGNFLPLRIGLDLLFLWPYAAITIKRGHDRDRSTRYTGVLLAVMYGLTWTMAGLMQAGNLMISGVLSLAVIGLGLYLLVDYGIIDGTKGPNRYGPSPKGHQGAGADVAKTFD